MRHDMWTLRNLRGAVSVGLGHLGASQGVNVSTAQAR